MRDIVNMREDSQAGKGKFTRGETGRQEYGNRGEANQTAVIESERQSERGEVEEEKVSVNE